MTSQTLLSLEERLGRVRFLLYGDAIESISDGSSNPSDTVALRLQKLERSMDALKARSGNVRQLIHLRKGAYRCAGPFPEAESRYRTTNKRT